MKTLKLPPFNEDKDDLDAYLIRFERACTAFEVHQEHRSTQLARLLQGKALRSEAPKLWGGSQNKKWELLISPDAL